MSPAETRALTMAYELHALLGELFDLPEHGPGSAVADAWDRMDDVIGLLEPMSPDDEDDTQDRRLRIVGGTEARS